MTRAVIAGLLGILIAVSVPRFVSARPLDRGLPHPVADGLARTAASGDMARPDAHGVLAGAAQDTAWFGGTFWAADSMRWEAIRDSLWTFDSGVGSDFDHFTPDVNPFKDPALHTHMEGWVGIDFTYEPANPHFRRSSAGEAGWSGSVCVGAPAGLGGQWSYWCGVKGNEAAALCYAAGQGYGNYWNVGIEREFVSAGGDALLEFGLTLDLEPGFDYLEIQADTGGVVGPVTVARMDGQASGRRTIALLAGQDLPQGGGAVTLRFLVRTDGAYSDEDGLYATDCGAVALDDIRLSGGIVYGPEGFEGSEGGWVSSTAAPGLGGDYADIRPLSDLPPTLAPCACGLEDSVLVFRVPETGRHTDFQYNIAASPWIDLLAAGVAGRPGKVLEFDLYAELYLLNYVFALYGMQWYPEVCAVSGAVGHSDWVTTGTVYYYGGVPYCPSPGSPQRLSGFPVPPGAEQLRVGIGVVNYCAYIYDCLGLDNSTPWFDNVRLGTFGTAGAPLLTIRDVDLPFDSFPTNGTLRMDATGRLDGNRVLGASSPEPFTSLGDTLVVQGGAGGVEVRVQFAVRPGPWLAGGAGAGDLAAWLGSHQAETVWRNLPWYSARMDTAERGGLMGSSLSFMTAYHEEDPNFQGTDRSLHPTDVAPTGARRLLNDIFPDDLFTPGTRVEMFYKARYDGSNTPFTGAWFLLPDTTGGNVFEMEVLPSSMAADTTWNCVLYVDHADGSSTQSVIESALRAVMPGASANAEGVPWDRWDVRAPTSNQASFGRPPQTEYGATAAQAWGYRAILWDSGSGSASNLSEYDAQRLTVWLAHGPVLGGEHHLYLAGDNLASSIQGAQAVAPAAMQLMEDYLGVTFTCGTIRDASCPGAPSLPDETPCMPLAPSGDPLDHFAGNSGSGTVTLAGNGCPERRSFDLIAANPYARGEPVGNEIYASPVKGALAYHSVANRYHGDGAPYRTVMDAASPAWRRDAGCGDAVSAASDRLGRVLEWFGMTGSAQGCEEPQLSQWPNCQASVFPATVILTPDGSYENVLYMECDGAPLANSYVEIRFSAYADSLIRWGTGQSHPAIGGFIDEDGYFRFAVAGGLCPSHELPPGADFLARIFVDGIIFWETWIVSPDAVNDQGQLPTDPAFEECGGLRVTAADVEFHQANLGSTTRCSDFDGDGLVTQSDVDFAASFYGVAGTPAETWPPCTILDAEPPVAVTRVLGAAPNPFRGATRIAFELDRAQSVAIAVHDVSGRLLRVLADAPYPAGRHAVAWDGRDGHGRATGPGIYLVRVRTETLVHTGKILQLR